MKIKADIPIAFLRDKGVHPLIRAYIDLCQLKQLYRQGWLRHVVAEQRCESVAEHSFATVLLAMWLAEVDFKGLDMQKIIQIALVHDLGEIYAGDIIPSIWSIWRKNDVWKQNPSAGSPKTCPWTRTSWNCGRNSNRVKHQKRWGAPGGPSRDGFTGRCVSASRICWDG